MLGAGAGASSSMVHRVHLLPCSHLKSHVCPSLWCLADAVLPAVGSPWDAGSTKALPALHGLQLPSVPSSALLSLAGTEERDWGETNRNE